MSFAPDFGVVSERSKTRGWRLSHLLQEVEPALGRVSVVMIKRRTSEIGGVALWPGLDARLPR